MATIESHFESICINPNDDLVLYKKEIVRSRIEKFLYAICSLDTDDLPTPLSRIEELYNCLVTGEDIPTFTPLSRAEKFVMAMLGAYDVELLPTPISRSETLMKKIATGDNNLDDVDSLQSRYEFLLAYIIKAGGFNGGSEDFYYNLTSLTSGFTTIYDTFDMPVKNAILKGNTLVNLATNKRFHNGFVTYGEYLIQPLKNNTKYLLILDNIENVQEVGLTDGDWNTQQLLMSGLTLKTKCVFTLNVTSPSTITNIRVLLTTGPTQKPDYKIMLIEYQEGMENWDIPYFEGMQSVKMPVLTTSNEDGTKSNILTCNEDVELRSIGDIKDELNLLTGELTQRINEIVLNGSEEWTLYEHNTPSVIGFYTSVALPNVLPALSDDQRRMVLSDTFIFKNQLLATDEEFIFISNTGKLNLNIKRSKLNAIDVTSFKSYLASNPLTIQYQLETESVKTVDLSTLDQDGKETELNTFDDITHVITSSEGLAPTGEIDIARPVQFVDYSLDNGLTTLYNTIDYPVKNAVLRGQTLVNLGGTYNRTDTPTWFTVFATQQEVKQGNVYYAIINNTGDGLMRLRYKTSDAVIKAVNPMSCEKFIFTATESDYLRIKNSDTISNCDGTFLLLKYQNGMENWDISYFEGMTSVKMPVLTTTGKNLVSKTIRGTQANQGGIMQSEIYRGLASEDLIKVKKGETYQLSGEPMPSETYAYATFDINKIFLGMFWGSTYNVSDDVSFVRTFMLYNKDTDLSNATMQLEENSVATSYEPYKSNILTCNEDVKLRSVGSIKDELNLLTGKYIQHIKEVVFDGSDDEIIGMVNVNDTTLVRFNILNVEGVQAGNINKVLCSSLPYLHIHNLSGGSATVSQECITNHSEDANVINIVIKRSRLSSVDVNGFRAYLQSNPITIQYSIATPIIKTVELSVVDQDGKETKLNTFDDITHVTVSSEGLVPTGEITVATKNVTDVVDASVMSLRMDDILNSQRTLEGPANAQSDDIDVAMLGTTDIYEQLL